MHDKIQKLILKVGEMLAIAIQDEVPWSGVSIHQP